MRRQIPAFERRLDNLWNCRRPLFLNNLEHEKELLPNALEGEREKRPATKRTRFPTIKLAWRLLSAVSDVETFLVRISRRISSDKFMTLERLATSPVSRSNLSLCAFPSAMPAFFVPPTSINYFCVYRSNGCFTAEPRRRASRVAIDRRNYAAASTTTLKRKIYVPQQNQFCSGPLARSSHERSYVNSRRGRCPMQKKYQVFVSSTFRDLIDERQDTMKSILDLGHIPAGMEGFPAMDVEQLKYIKKIIDECDYYILILGARYGSVDSEGVSFTEREYLYAVEAGKTVLAFVHSNTDVLPPEKADSDPRTVQRLSEFKHEVMRGRLVHNWHDRDSLKYGVFKSLVAAFDEQPAVGWIRASAAASEDLLGQINALRIRNDELESRLSHLQSQLSPAIDDIAPLDSKYEIRYTYTLNGTTRNGSVNLTWRQIFVAVGPELVQAHSPAKISTAIQRYARENDFVSRYVKLLDSDEHQIKVQLAAYGLIDNYVAPNTSGGHVEWVKMTEMGKRVLLETMVVKK